MKPQIITDWLFHSRGTLQDFFEEHRKQLSVEINKLAEKDILNQDIPILCEKIRPSFYLEPLELLTDSVTKKTIEGTVIRRDPFDDKEYTATATIMRMAIPFKGKRELFQYKARYYNPRGTHGSIVNDTLVFDIEYNPESFAKIFQVRMETFKESVQYTNQEVNRFNNSLNTVITRHLNEKKELLKKIEADMAQFNITEKLQEESPIETHELPVSTEDQMSPEINEPSQAKFSQNFRDITFYGTFSPLQAKALEFMHTEKEKGHQKKHFKDILDYVYDGPRVGNATKMQALFQIKVKGKKVLHPLFKVILKSTKGYYELKI